MFIKTLPYIGQVKESAKYTRIPLSIGHAHRTVHSDRRSCKQFNNSTRLRINRSHNRPCQRCFRDAVVWSHVNLPPIVSIESSHHNCNLFAGRTLSLYIFLYPGISPAGLDHTIDWGKVVATSQISKNLFHYGTCGSADHVFLLLCIITYQSIHFMSLTKFGNSQDSAPKQNLFPLLLLCSAEWLPTSL